MIEIVFFRYFPSGAWIQWPLGPGLGRWVMEEVNGINNGCILSLRFPYSRCDLWTSNISTTWYLVRKVDLQVPVHPGYRPTDSESALEQNSLVVFGVCNSSLSFPPSLPYSFPSSIPLSPPPILVSPLPPSFFTSTIPSFLPSFTWAAFRYKFT